MSTDGADGVPPGYLVVGGAGGTRARLEGLLAAAAAADRAAGRLEAALARAREVDGCIDAVAVWSPLTAPTARAATAALTSGWTGLHHLAARTRRLAASLRSAAQIYRHTDLDVAAVIRALGAVAGGWVAGSGPVGIVLTGAVATAGAITLAQTVLAARLLRYVPSPAGFALQALGSARLRRLDGPVGMLARTVGGPGLLPQGLGPPSGPTVEMLVPVIAGLGVGALPGDQPLSVDPVPTAALGGRVGALIGTALFGTPRPGLVVAPVVTPEARRGPDTAPPVPRSTADVLREVQSLYPDDDTAGTVVGVQRLDHPDGHRSWVVTIPGTQSGDVLDGPNPADMAANLELAAGLRSDAGAVVVHAMLRAGVQPGEPVLLAGHSQGGMVAMDIAADPLLRSAVTVTAVVTAGSPVAVSRLPDGVQALHLEHVQDYVPALDGRPNPDDSQRTTVVRDLQVPPGPRDARAPVWPMAAHDLGTYIDTAEALDTTDHASLRRFDAALAEVVGGGGAVSTYRRYAGVRVTAPPPAP